MRNRPKLLNWKQETTFWQTIFTKSPENINQDDLNKHIQKWDKLVNLAQNSEKKSANDFLNQATDFFSVLYPKDLPKADFLERHADIIIDYLTELSKIPQHKEALQRTMNANFAERKLIDIAKQKALKQLQSDPFFMEISYIREALCFEKERITGEKLDDERISILNKIINRIEIEITKGKKEYLEALQNDYIANYKLNSTQVTSEAARCAKGACKTRINELIHVHLLDDKDLNIHRLWGVALAKKLLNFLLTCTVIVPLVKRSFTNSWFIFNSSTKAQQRAYEIERDLKTIDVKHVSFKIKR